ncbi:MAG: LruC domain-containing protein, partial [Chitinophagaceae bacterium]
MKKLIIQFTLVATLVLPFFVNAQTVKLDAESGNRAIDAAQCWVFGALSYTSQSSQIVTGKWSMRSNQPTSMNPASCWLKSPWLLAKQGNISFKFKFEAPINGTRRRIYIAYVPYFEQASWASKEAPPVLFDSIDFAVPFPALTRDIQFPVPATLYNSNNPAKIIISFVGEGGTMRYNIDDISIPGTIVADATNNCLPKNNQPADADGDGVLDEEDAFPNDAKRAFVVNYPAEGFGTYLFEDNWPQNGDYDFNDLVLGYQYQFITNSDNKLVDLKGTIAIKAIGAVFQNGFAIQLDRLSPNLVTKVSGTQHGNVLWAVLSANGTEAGQTNANIIIFDNASRLMKANTADGFINTVNGTSFVTPDTTRFTINFEENRLSISDIQINPYLILAQNRQRELHLPDFAPTDKADKTIFSTGDDKSAPNAGIYYKNKQNLPWAIDVPYEIPYSVEKIDITNAYLVLPKWAQS